MRLGANEIENRKWWIDRGYRIPEYDRAAVKKLTEESPFWIHFGAGNIFRAFQANMVQTLLNEGELDRGLIVAEGYDFELVERMSRPYDDYHLLVTLKSDGNLEKTVIGSIIESLTVDTDNKCEWTRLQDIFAKDSLQMISFTITEKGYCLQNPSGEWYAQVEQDFAVGPENPQSYMGKVAALLYARFKNGKKPVAMVSMDNCSHNGDKLFEAIHTFAKKWTEAGLAESDFLNYIKDRKQVSFPWTMIDKITPRPDESVEHLLEQDGLENMQPVVTSKNTYAAPFVNAEECEYLVIEDVFPNGKPEVLSRAGVIFTERRVVELVERMKVCTCLNPLHTTLAVFGCLLGYHKISEEMKDPELKKLVERLGYEEGLPVAAHPGIIEPKEFLDTVIEKRIPNPFLPDTPQRIATDTSQKLAVRFGETIKAYLKEGKSLQELKVIPLVFAGWIRYLVGVDDNGETYTLSPDPLLKTLKPYIQNLYVGEAFNVEEKIAPLLRMEAIFGVDLYQVDMAHAVVTFLEEMLQGEGAVRTLLKNI